MPEESLAPVAEFFRHRFLQALREGKHLSAQKITELLSWNHRGFHVDGGEKPVAPGDTKGRQRLAEYLLRAPFSLQKIHWNPKTVVDTFFRPGEIEFFLRLHGLWEFVIDIPPPPDPPFDIETFEPVEPPWQAIREWIPADDGEPGYDLFDQRPGAGQPVEIPREDGSILVLDSD